MTIKTQGRIGPRLLTFWKSTQLRKRRRREKKNPEQPD
jgi:hypothetical protein